MALVLQVSLLLLSTKQHNTIKNIIVIIIIINTLIIIIIIIITNYVIDGYISSMINYREAEGVTGYHPRMTLRDPHPRE